MLRRASWLVPALALSCAVRGFSIVDDLPGPRGGAAGDSAAGMSSGASSSSGNASGGSDGGSSGGKAQGGQSPQAGSPNQGGTPAVEAGAPGMGDAGAGGGGGDEPTAVEPCALDQSGMAPMFCEDFEQGSLVPPRWNIPPGIMADMIDGPHGQTRALHLQNFQATPGVGDFNLQAAGTDVTVSFWFRSSGSPQQNTNLISFQDRSAAATRLKLVWDLEGLAFVNNSMISAPSQPSDPIPFDKWVCVAVYMTTGLIQVIYKPQADPAAHEFTIDSVPTPGVDDAWQNQPEDQKAVAGFPMFGAEPVFPGTFWLDDLRIVRGNSNVCGF
jgi:hypothetical protein